MLTKGAGWKRHLRVVSAPRPSNLRARKMLRLGLTARRPSLRSSGGALRQFLDQLFGQSGEV